MSQTDRSWHRSNRRWEATGMPDEAMRPIGKVPDSLALRGLGIRDDGSDSRKTDQRSLKARANWSVTGLTR